MGLFDDIQVNLDVLDITEEEKVYLLKNSTDNYGSFQTKDLDNAMDLFRVAEDGRLKLNEFDLVDVPLEERPDKSFPFIGMFNRVNERWIDANYHGYITFYSPVSDDKELPMGEFRAKFTDGKLVEVIRIRDMDADRSWRRYRISP